MEFKKTDIGSFWRLHSANHLIPKQYTAVRYVYALAVTLELSSPCPLFGEPEIHVDPFQRYIHYEQVYLLGELDPNILQFNVWEMRHIVYSDATKEEELGWGRHCLLNYRPDHVYSDDPQWRYSRIVHTDVHYKVPDW
jgi:hypothetical protein